ncbi:CAP domain-containing protein [Natronincola peptidivorans]|uniref:CAP domain-containing protein n=1 Tax=Natronincola peptidivorans TaxID=426128 RepID=UPI00147B0453|nr:CAP domain-containing protein [Natronincola peptidivorans]
MKNILKKTSIFLLVGLFLIQSTTLAHASWGAQRLLQQQSQSTTTVQPTNTQPQQQQNSPSNTPSNTPIQSNNQSTSDLIRSLRTNQSTSLNNHVPENNNIHNTNNNVNNSAPVTTQPTIPSNVQNNMSSMESMMLDLVNKERSKRGLAPLQWHNKLAGVAKLKTQDIIQNNYFAHNSPTYGSFFQMISNEGISYRQAGENLAKARDVQRAHMLLMASEGHRNNILSPSFTHIGLGISTDQYGIVVTQLFIQ